jgi:hypothetical protein
MKELKTFVKPTKKNILNKDNKSSQFTTAIILI